MASRYEAEYIWPKLMATAPTRDVGWRYCYFALTIVNQFTNSTYYILLVANAGIDPTVRTLTANSPLTIVLSFIK
ncbi:hypothetical protein I310019A7_36470 [Lawsonibacter asaccharolyticus]